METKNFTVHSDTSTSPDSISVRLEGGLGDILLGNRFVVAIKDKYPNAKINAFLDTEGNTFQEQGLRATYGHLYESITTITEKRYPKCMIKSQFGQEEYKGALENVPNDFFQRMLLDSDIFFDLHIDGLNWLDYDIDFLRYHRFFPKPKFTERYSGELPEKFIVVNLVSESSAAHRLQGWYIERLIKDLSAILPVVAIATDKTKGFYGCPTVVAPIGEALEVISRASLMVSTDSGLRYIAYGCDVPVITFSSQSNQPHQVLPSHQLRWLINPELCFPLNYAANYIAALAKKIVSSKVYALMPTLSDNLDLQIVRRHYELVDGEAQE